MRASRWALVLTLAASGCATTLPDQSAALNAASVCCKGYADFRYATLQVDKPQAVTLGPGSPAFEFDTGKSYFFAARLPAYSSPLALNVESQGTIAGEDRTSVLRPEILILDQDYQVTRRIPGESFKHTRMSDFVSTVFINQDNAAEAYVVVFTRTAGARQSDTVKRFTPYTFSLGGAPITLDGTEQTVPLAFGPGRALTISLQRYQPQRISR